MPTALQPRWFIKQPSDRVVAEFLRAQVHESLSYAEVGESRQGTPAGYALDHNRVQIGRGDRDYKQACEAVREWRMFPRPWTEISPRRAPVVEGTLVAMQAHALGFWWLNACRIVYVVDEYGPVRRFGFAYGTLRSHVEQGEERFTVELQPDGSVWYDLRAFSRPRYWPVRLGKPLARRLQRRFVRDSQAAMKDAIIQAGSK